MASQDKIRVKFFGGLSHRDIQGGSTEVSLSVGATVGKLITALHFEDHQVGTVLVNGKSALRDAALKGGDEVALFKPRG